MSDLKPLILYGRRSANPTKVAVILAELDLPYSLESDIYPDPKSESFIALNPNGRYPALEDPNTGLVIWESGACIDYLIDHYDTTHKLSFPHGSNEKHLARSWAHFQMSGQGPYFGQKVWFERFHSEKLPSAIERYRNEIRRVVSVIDIHLKKQGTQNLLGDKLSYADLMFVPWFSSLPYWVAPELDFSEFKHYTIWLKRMLDRPKTAKIIDAMNAPYKM